MDTIDITQYTIWCEIMCGVVPSTERRRLLAPMSCCRAAAAVIQPVLYRAIAALTAFHGSAVAMPVIRSYRVQLGGGTNWAWQFGTRTPATSLPVLCGIQVTLHNRGAMPDIRITTTDISIVLRGKDAIPTGSVYVRSKITADYGLSRVSQPIPCAEINHVCGCDSEHPLYTTITLLMQSMDYIYWAPNAPIYFRPRPLTPPGEDTKTLHWIPFSPA